MNARRGLSLFWVQFAIAAAMAAAVVVFFVSGLSDGTVSSSNGLLWAALLFGCAAYLGVAYRLKASGRLGPANLMLLPSTLLGVLLLGVLAVLIFDPPDFR